MAKYSDIKGFTVQTVSSDPVASQFAGGSWASGGALNSERSQMAGVGSQTAALGFGGNTPGSPKSAANEQYNGSSWTELNDLNSARAGMYGFGTTTAAIGSGGLVYPFNPSNFATNLTESWNGSTWTETSDMTYGRATGGSATSGTSTAGLIFGGGYLSPSPNYALVAYTESWDGSSWTEVNDLNSARGYGMGGAGTQTSALAFGGNIPPSPSTTLIATESWDGSSWTEVNDMNTKREGVAGSGADNTSAIAVAGNVPPLTGITEIWNGTSWTEVADLSTARTSVGSAGTTVASLAFGGGVPGSSPSISTLTEEFTAPSTFTKQIEGQLFFNSTANTFKETMLDVAGATWASGGAFPSSQVQFAAGAGTQTAAVSVAGYSPPSSSPFTGAFSGVFKYDGTSWSSNPNNYPTNVYGFWGSGTQTAGLFTGGAAPGNIATTNKFDGTSFTSTGDLNSARRYLASNGTQTASIAAGGYTTTQVGIVEDFDGSSWTETGDMNNTRQQHSQTGSSTASLAIGKSPASGIVESWDGTSWTAVSALNSARQSTGASGTQAYGLAYAGEDSGGTPQAKTEHWNGSTWTEVNDMSNARYGVGSLGFSASASAVVAWAGATNATSTEEFTVNLDNKTITAS